MKAKNWIIACIVMLTSTIYAIAQEGESTIEGVPVVNEIVTDSTTSNQPVTITKNGPHAGTWQIITYSNDSIDNAEIVAEFTEEFYEDMPDFIKGLIGLTGFSLASGAMLLVFIVLLCIFGLPLILLFILLYLIFRKRKTKVYSNENQPIDETTSQTPDRTIFNKGVKNVCLGIGLAIALGIWMGDFGVGVGILITCIGIGELLIDYFSKK